MGQHKTGEKEMKKTKGNFIRRNVVIFIVCKLYSFIIYKIKKCLPLIFYLLFKLFTIYSFTIYYLI